MKHPQKKMILGVSAILLGASLSSAGYAVPGGANLGGGAAPAPAPTPTPSPAAAGIPAKLKAML